MLAGAAGGAGIGTTIGLAGGPFDPVTVPAGALIGGLLGAGGAGIGSLLHGNPKPQQAAPAAQPAAQPTANPAQQISPTFDPLGMQYLFSTVFAPYLQHVHDQYQTAIGQQSDPTSIPGFSAMSGQDQTRTRAQQSQIGQLQQNALHADEAAIPAQAGFQQYLNQLQSSQQGFSSLQAELQRAIAQQMLSGSVLGSAAGSPGGLPAGGGAQNLTPAQQAQYRALLGLPIQ
jgi:hypothetical protein